MWQTPGTATAFDIAYRDVYEGCKPCWNSFNKHFYSLAIAGLFLFSKQKGADTLHNLIITEKPSVARTISKVLGATTRRDGYLKAAATLSAGVWDTWWSWPARGV